MTLAKSSIACKLIKYKTMSTDQLYQQYNLLRFISVRNIAITIKISKLCCWSYSIALIFIKHEVNLIPSSLVIKLYVILSIVVIPCPDLLVPRDGALVCDGWLLGLYCQMMCREGYDIPLNGPGEYVCSDSTGVWRPDDYVPDCTRNQEYSFVFHIIMITCQLIMRM